MTKPAAKPIILMCPPTYFEPAPPHPTFGYANAFEAAGRTLFEKDPAGFRERAMEQWLNLKSVFERHAIVVLLDPIPGWHDQVYTADASFSVAVHNGAAQPRIVTVLSNFSNEKRAPEVETHRAAIAALGDNRIIVQSDHKIEGNGDNIPDRFRNIIWSGYTDPATFENAQHGRSSLHAHKFLQEHTGLEVISVRTRKPYYHDDTVLAPLQRGHVLAHYQSLHPSAHETFLANAFSRFNLDPKKYLITVNDNDAARLAVNVRCFGENAVVMPKCSPRLLEKVKRKDYDVETVDLSIFLAGGGNGHCLSNVANEPIYLPH